MSDKEGDKIYLTIQELNDWLFERVADDRDVVLDEMQDEFFATLAQAESDNVEGSDEYKANIEAVRTTLQDLQRPGNKATVVTELKKKITDGFRSLLTLFTPTSVLTVVTLFPPDLVGTVATSTIKADLMVKASCNTRTKTALPAPSPMAS